MTWNEFAEKAVRVPFLEKGRSWEGWDCWGLVVVAYREILKIELQGFEDHYVTTGPRHHDQLAKALMEGAKDWRPAIRQPGAVAGILRRGRCIHVGIAIGKYDILHCEHGIGTVLDRQRDLAIEGYWQPAWIDSWNLAQVN